MLVNVSHIHIKLPWEFVEYHTYPIWFLKQNQSLSFHVLCCHFVLVCNFKKLGKQIWLMAER